MCVCVCGPRGKSGWWHKVTLHSCIMTAVGAEVIAFSRCRYEAIYTHTHTHIHTHMHRRIRATVANADICDEQLGTGQEELPSSYGQSSISWQTSEPCNIYGNETEVLQAHRFLLAIVSVERSARKGGVGEGGIKKLLSSILRQCASDGRCCGSSAGWSMTLWTLHKITRW